MDVICLDDDVVDKSEVAAVQDLSDESDDLLPDYPVPSLSKVAHGQPVNTAPITLQETVAPNVSGRKGKRKAKVRVEVPVIRYRKHE